MHAAFLDEIRVLIIQVLEQYEGSAQAPGLSRQGLAQLYMDGVGDCDMDFHTIQLADKSPGTARQCTLSHNQLHIHALLLLLKLTWQLYLHQCRYVIPRQHHKVLKILQQLQLLQTCLIIPQVKSRLHLQAAEAASASACQLLTTTKMQNPTVVS